MKNLIIDRVLMHKPVKSNNISEVGWKSEITQNRYKVSLPYIHHQQLHLQHELLTNWNLS